MAPALSGPTSRAWPAATASRLGGGLSSRRRLVAARSPGGELPQHRRSVYSAVRLSRRSRLMDHLHRWRRAREAARWTRGRGRRRAGGRAGVEAAEGARAREAARTRPWLQAAPRAAGRRAPAGSHGRRGAEQPPPGPARGKASARRRAIVSEGELLRLVAEVAVDRLEGAAAAAERTGSPRRTAPRWRFTAASCCLRRTLRRLGGGAVALGQGGALTPGRPAVTPR